MLTDLPQMNDAELEILFKLKAVFNVKGRPVNAALMLVSILCLPPRKVRTRFCHILVPHVHVNQ